MLKDKQDKSIEEIREAEFREDRGIINCNHATIGSWPKRTIEAVQSMAAQNHGAGVDPNHYLEWEEKTEVLRGHIRKLINAHSLSEIAFLKNTSEGLSAVARGVNWQSGDNIVYAAQEFPSNRFAWDAVARDFGIEVRVANLESDKLSGEAALIQKMDHHTRLVAVSSIQFVSGYRMNLKQLKDACLSYGALLCVDAIQSVGASPFDVQECGADFACGGSHKWLLAPEGAAFFYCSAEHLDTLKLHQYGWRMRENPMHFDVLGMKVADSAKRFEYATMNNLGLLALEKSTGLLLETGMERVYEAVESNVSYLMEHLDKKKFSLLTDENPDKRGGILSVSLRGGSVKRVYATLMQEKIRCAMRVGRLRLSPHFYTQKSELDKIVAIANGA